MRSFAESFAPLNAALLVAARPVLPHEGFCRFTNSFTLRFDKTKPTASGQLWRPESREGPNLECRVRKTFFKRAPRFHINPPLKVRSSPLRFRLSDKASLPQALSGCPVRRL